MKKELLINDKPPITVLQTIALPLSIATVEPGAWDWMSSEFIQTYTFGVNELDNSYLNFKIYQRSHNLDYKTLECIDMSSNIDKLNMGEDIIKLFKMLIDNDYYIFINCNNYYVPNTSWYHKQHFPHDFLLYGYDDDRSSFNFFAYGNTIKLSRWEISYEDLMKAYYSNDIDIIYEREYRLILYKRKTNLPGIDIERLRWLLADYLDSVDTFAREVPGRDRDGYKYSWGLDTYDVMLRYYKRAKDDRSFLFRNEFYGLYDHKQFMRKRAVYLNDNSDIKVTSELLESMEEVEKRAYETFQLVLKNNMLLKANRNTDEVTEDIIKNLEFLKDKEEKTLNSYYNLNRKVLEG